MKWNELLNAFGTWLEDNQIYSKQYYNYMRALVNKFFSEEFEKMFGKNCFECFAEKPAKPTNAITRNFLVLCKCLIEKDLEDINSGKRPRSGKSKKTLQDYQSGFYAFEEFVLTEGYNINAKKIENKDIEKVMQDYSSGKIRVSYSKGQLIKIFKSRLTTQDRVYEKILYPARLINKIFNNSPSFHQKYMNLIENAIKRTKFVVDEDGKTLELGVIKSISINPFKKHDVMVVPMDGSKACSLYSRKNRTKGQFGEFEAKKGIASLSLDHDSSLESILNENVSDFPELKRLSEIVAKHEGNRDSDYKKYLSGSKQIKEWTKSVFNDCSAEINKDINRLYEEIESLYDKKIGLTVMEGSENSSKGKGE